MNLNRRAAWGLAVLAGIGLAIAGTTITARAQAPTADGANIFSTTCAACHGAEGQGGAGPALAANADLAENALVINQVLFGGEMMPPFGDQLSDDEIAAVLNFVRSSFGNTNATPIEVQEVTATRAAG